MTRLGEYTFQVERLSGVIDECKPMFLANHLETGTYDRPFNPDYNRYLELAESNALMFMTARKNGMLVGYALFFLNRHIYQRDVISACQSLNYVDKGHRGIGYSFMKFCDDSLRKQGVNSVWRQATSKFDISKLYERMGYTLVEKSYRKEL